MSSSSAPGACPALRARQALAVFFPMYAARGSRAAARLGAHVYGLNAHAGMASALAAAMKAEERNRNSGSSTFSREASRVGGALLRDFARSGMFLPTSAARKAASEAEAAAAAASMRFTDALADPEAGGVRFRASWSNNAPIAATPAAVAAALRFEPDPELRQKCYEAAFSRETTRHLTIPLHEMLEARARRAEALGFGEKGWRGMLIDDDDGGESGGGESGGGKGKGGGGLEVSLAGSASTVRSFLLDLAGQLRPLAEEQASLLSRAKKRARARSEGGNGRSDPETLQPWDVAFFSARVRGEAAARAAARASGGLLSSASAAPASPQVPVEDAVAGVLDVLEAAVGVRLVRAELRRGEGWAPFGVAKFVAVDVGGGGDKKNTPKIIGGPLSLDRVDPARVLGDVYLDLAPRPAKFPGAAHFTLRCGRNFVLGPSEEEESGGGRGSRGGGKASARPAVAIVASFSGLRETGRENNSPRSSSSSSPSSASSSPPPSSLPWLGSLAWSETTTLLHEGGHALHSLLSRTEFQHLSGTRGPLDVVELPSHVAERWARLPVGCGSGSGRGSEASEAAGAAAAALATRGRVSRVDFVAAEAARRATAALDFLGQVTDALVDAELHRGSGNGGGGKFSAEAAASDAAALVAALSPLPQASFSSSSSPSPPLLFSPHARFGHLAGYGGAYYSYVYAECVAADVCARSAGASGSRAGGSGRRDLTEAEELELTRRALRSGGEALRESLLRHGCSAPPREAVRELLASSSSGGGGEGGGMKVEAEAGEQEGSKRGGWSPDPAARLAEVVVL